MTQAGTKYFPSGDFLSGSPAVSPRAGGQWKRKPMSRTLVSERFSKDTQYCGTGNIDRIEGLIEFR